VSVDMIVQNVGSEGRAEISFTVPKDELTATKLAIEEAKSVLGEIDVVEDDQVAKVSVVGLGMAHQTGVAHQMFGALARDQINIQMITTSEIKISTLVPRDDALPALRAVHRAFQLETPAVSTDREDAGDESSRRTVERRKMDRGSAIDVVESLQGMEELTIHDIMLDKSQGSVSIFGFPDAPGMAEKVFAATAEGNINVDMIVQSAPHDTASLSFTVPKEELKDTAKIAASLVQQMPNVSIESSADVAKLSVSGIGLRSHTGVAIRMFRALAEAGINIRMINTSEVRVNVVVEGKDGDSGLAALKEAFTDAI